MSASGIIPSLGVPVPVTSPEIPILPTQPEVVLKKNVGGNSGQSVLTTSGSAQLIADIPISAIGIDLFQSEKAMLFIETGMDISSNPVPAGYAYAVCVDNDLSNATQMSRDYVTNIDPTSLSAPASFVLSRDVDYPIGSSNIQVWLTATNTIASTIPTSNAFGVSWTLSSLG